MAATNPPLTDLLNCCNFPKHDGTWCSRSTIVDGKEKHCDEHADCVKPILADTHLIINKIHKDMADKTVVFVTENQVLTLGTYVDILRTLQKYEEVLRDASSIPIDQKAWEHVLNVSMEHFYDNLPSAYVNNDTERMSVKWAAKERETFMWIMQHVGFNGMPDTSLALDNKNVNKAIDKLTHLKSIHPILAEIAVAVIEAVKLQKRD